MFGIVLYCFNATVHPKLIVRSADLIVNLLSRYIMCNNIFILLTLCSFCARVHSVHVSELDRNPDCPVCSWICLVLMIGGDYPIYCFGYFQTCNPDHYIGKRRSHQTQIHCYGLIVNCFVHEDLSSTQQLFDHFYSCNITGVDKLDRSIHHIMEQSGNFVNKD